MVGWLNRNRPHHSHGQDSAGAARIRRSAGFATRADSIISSSRSSGGPIRIRSGPRDSTYRPRARHSAISRAARSRSVMAADLIDRFQAGRRRLPQHRPPEASGAGPSAPMYRRRHHRHRLGRASASFRRAGHRLLRHHPPSARRARSSRSRGPEQKGGLRLERGRRGLPCLPRLPHPLQQ